MAGAELRVEIVRTRSAARAFLALPYQLHGRDPRWVAPLRLAERQRWSPRHNSSLAGRRVERFLARRGRQVVGRVAAIVDATFADAWLPGAGFFGFFDVEPDDAAAALLLSAAEQQLRSWDRQLAIGPVNLTTHEEAGVLIDGFDDPPTLLAPWNPPYYAELLEAAGYTRLRDYHAYRWTPAAHYSPAMRRLAQRRERLARTPAAHQAGGLIVRGLDAARFEDELRLLHDLYNRSFADLWGFVPLSWQEYRERAVSFRPFYRPALIRIAEDSGAAVGFAVVLPDVNEALRGLDGRLFPFGWLRLMRRLRRIHRGRFMLLGVLPSHRGRGVAGVLADSLYPLLADANIDEIEASLVQSENQHMHSVIAAMGSERSKTYRLYVRPFPPGPAAI